MECEISGRGRALISLITLCAAFQIYFPVQHSAFSIPTSHKVHVSIAQLEYNQKSQSVGITHRVYTDDLENAVRQHAKRPIKIDPATANKDKRVGEAILEQL